MKAILKSPVLRQTILFAALLLVALAAAQTSFAASTLISPSDAPSAISAATDGQTDFRALAQIVLDYFLGFLGFLAIIMIIYGGILYVTSAGNDTNVEKAKKILLYAIVGIILILLSVAIVNTVLGAASSGSSTTTGTATSI